MENLYDVIIECFCDKFCKLQGGECNEDTPTCAVDDAIKEAVRKHFTEKKEK